MITPGGEEAFVKKMVDESIMLGQRCRYVPFYIISYYLRAVIRRWYTSMVGKQSSLTALITLIRTHSVCSQCIAPTTSTLRATNPHYRSPTTHLLSWFRATLAAGRSLGPSQTRACRTYVQPLFPNQSDLDLFLSTLILARISPGQLPLHCVTSFRLERPITNLSAIHLPQGRCKKF